MEAPRTPEKQGTKGTPPKRMSIVQNIKASFSRASIRTVSSTSVPASVSEKTSAPVPVPTPADPRGIYTAQPSPYWTGRFTSLSDKHLTALTSSVSLSQTTIETRTASPHQTLTSRDPQERPLSRLFSASDVEKVEGALDEGNRARLVLRELEGLCRTEEARRSLAEWRGAWADRIGRPVVPRQRFLERLGFGRG
ncbi:hypothetical protein IMZ48_00480 [Candidatus Bathyarchaeota archaeon]|nr:hypothetical protein [Candidatus Bathyarchaeota archaeon]